MRLKLVLLMLGIAVIEIGAALVYGHPVRAQTVSEARAELDAVLADMKATDDPDRRAADVRRALVLAAIVYPPPRIQSRSPRVDQHVYAPSECIGPIINGVCHGAIQPRAGYHPTCHGQMLNGQCTGPMF